MNYQVGELIHYGPDDLEYGDKEAAFDAAIQLSDDLPEAVFGVWTGQDDGSELIAIAHNGELFRLHLHDFGIEITLPIGIVVKREDTSE